jgi:hypothetical protein
MPHGSHRRGVHAYAVTTACALALGALILFYEMMRTDPPAPDLTQRVTFSAPAMQAGRLLHLLSQRAGVALEAGESTRPEVLLLHVRGAPLAEVLDRLAEAAGSKWEVSGAARRLIRPPELELRQRDASLAERARSLARSLKEIEGYLAQPWTAPTLTAAVRYVEKEQRTGQVMPERVAWLDPGRRLLARCLSDVKPAEIAAIAPGCRVVWATDPTPMQRPLGAGACEALRLLVPEQQFFGKTLRKAGVEPGWEDEELQFFAEQSCAGARVARHDPWRRLSPYPVPPARVLLSLACKWNYSYEWKVSVLNAQQRLLLEMESFDSDEIRDRIWVDEPDSAAPGHSAVAGPFVQFSADTRRLLRTFQSPAPASGDPALPPDVVELLTHPEEHEPLGTIISDGYLTLARREKQNLVAALPDRLLDRAWTDVEKGRLSLADFLRWPRYEQKMKITRRGGWIIVTPPDPFASRQERADRDVLGRVARSAVAAGRLTVEDWADFMAHAGDLPMYHFGESILWRLTKGQMGDSGSPNYLTLYGCLDANQRKALLSGKQVNFGSLSPGQRLLAERAVYGARYNSIGGGTAPVPRELGDLADEPTEAFPQGLPPDRGLRAVEKRVRQVRFLVPEGKRGEGFLWSITTEDPPGPRIMTGPGIQLPADGFARVKYEVQPERVVHFEVDETPWSWSGQDFVELSAEPIGPAVPLQQLPPDLRRRVTAEIEWLKQTYGGH